MATATKRGARKTPVPNPPQVVATNKPKQMLDGSRIGKWAPARMAMEVDYQVVRALRGGTTAMRSMREVFLPRDQGEREEPRLYNERLLRTFLSDGYGEGVANIAARPFQRPVKLANAEKLPDMLQRIEVDADRQGTSLTRLAHMALDSGTDRGAVHILVDMPAVAQKVDPLTNTPRDRTLQDDYDDDLRPYFCIVSADNLVNWAWRKDATGRDVLAMVMIYEARDGVSLTGEVGTIERIRYWTETEWQVWEREGTAPMSASAITTANDLLQVARMAGTQNEGNVQRPYKLVTFGGHDLGKVPIVSVVLNKYGNDRLQARPCLINCAWKNVEQWQIASSRANVLWYSGFPILVGAGLSAEQVEEGVPLGAGAQYLSTNENASVEFAEPGGISAQSLKERELELIEQMKGMALSPLLRVTGNKTATGEAIDEKQSQSLAQSWVEALEWGFYAAYEMAAKWIGKDLPEDFELSIFRDFSLGARSATDLQTLDAARARGDISRETYIRELVERGVAVTITDVDDELNRIADEGDKLAEMMPSPQFGGGGGFGKNDFGGGDPNMPPPDKGAKPFPPKGDA